MNVPIAKKPDNKGKAKPATTKPAADQEKAINQLKQEIRVLAKAVIDMQQQSETEAVLITMPKELFTRLNAYISDYEHSSGNKLSLSEYVNGAVDVILYSDEDDARRMAEEKMAELEKSKQKKIQE